MPSSNVFDPTNYLSVIPNGAPVWHNGTGSISYSLLTAIPSYYAISGGNFQIDSDTFPAISTPELTATQAAQATLAVQRYNEVAQLNITLASSGVGDITFGALIFSDPSLYGFSYYPDEIDIGGDVWLNNAMSIVGAPSLYDEGWDTIIHELGHALGLQHPFEDLAFPLSLENSLYSVMSYSPVPAQEGVSDPTQQWPATPMLYDIQALQALYGANMSTRTGNDTYFINSGVNGFAIANNQSKIATIWDAGGIDTFSGAHQSSQVVIDLRPGHFSTIGSIADNIGIALGVEGTGAKSAWIENAVGGSAGDILIGNELGNKLNGQVGADTMQGGTGDDYYYVDNSKDYVIEQAGEGNDTVIARVSFALWEGSSIEVLRADVINAPWGVRLTGNSDAQRIYGDFSDDTLVGNGGADTMIGEMGRDIYFVDDASDRVIEQNLMDDADLDTIITTVSFQLIDDGDLEVIRISGAAWTEAIDLTGNNSSQALFGNAGHNQLDGRGGADTLTGYGGNDSYYVDQAGDRVIESVNGGDDVVFASVTYSLSAGQEVETLKFRTQSSTEDVSLGGNEKNQLIAANNGDNILFGGGGADTMVGYLGNDVYFVDASGDFISEKVGEGRDIVRLASSFSLNTQAEVEVMLTVNTSAVTAIDLIGNGFDQTIYGNNGANLIDGGLGSDALKGNGGADTFRFSTALDADNVDRILDFSVPADTIALENTIFTRLGANGQLSASAFALSTAAMTVNTRIVYNATSGGLFYDADGSGASAPIKFASLTGGLALSASDFLIV